MRFSEKLFLCAALAGALALGAAETPWGVAAHLHRNQEYDNLDRELKLMRDTGITAVRTDFRYRVGEAERRREDDIVDRVRAAGLEVLAVVAAFDWEIRKVHPDAVPMWKHPDKWRAYMRETARRYKGKIRHWEIWNEQDGGFWKPDPDASQYVPLLKIAYEELKKADPENLVIVGGLCGWNRNYLRSMYQCGAKGSFDAIAVHPYGEGPVDNAYQMREMTEFKKLMAAHGDAGKKLWITECGGSTYRNSITGQDSELALRALRFAAGKIGRPFPAPGKIVVGMPIDKMSTEAIVSGFNWLPGATIRPISAADLATVSVDELPFMIGAYSETVAEEYVEPLLQYLNRGGIVIVSGGVPFYFMDARDAAGNVRHLNAAEILHPKFRLGFEAWWTRKDIPRGTWNIRITPTAAAAGFPALKNGFVDRFLSDKHLQKGDRFFPLVEAFRQDGAAIAPVMGVYTFGDRKGALAAASFPLGTGYSEKGMAELLPRIYVSYLANGVERLFLYDFHNDGRNGSSREDNFGLVRWDFSPKPGCHAYREMTEALGRAPKFLKTVREFPPEVFGALFERAEDGKHVLAYWSVTEKSAVGKVKYAGHELSPRRKVQFHTED